MPRASARDAASADDLSVSRADTVPMKRAESRRSHRSWSTHGQYDQAVRWGRTPLRQGAPHLLSGLRPRGPHSGGSFDPDRHGFASEPRGEFGPCREASYDVLRLRQEQMPFDYHGIALLSVQSPRWPSVGINANTATSCARALGEYKSWPKGIPRPAPPPKQGAVANAGGLVLSEHPMASSAVRTR